MVAVAKLALVHPCWSIGCTSACRETVNSMGWYWVYGHSSISKGTDPYYHGCMNIPKRLTYSCHFGDVQGYTLGLIHCNIRKVCVNSRMFWIRFKIMKPQTLFPHEPWGRFVVCGDPSRRQSSQSFATSWGPPRTSWWTIVSPLSSASTLPLGNHG